MLTVLNNIIDLRQSHCHCPAQLWRIERADGVVLRFTTHNRSLEYAGETYTPAGGIGATAHQKMTGLRAQNLDLIGMLTSEHITDEDLHAGLYTRATVHVFDVDWRWPWAGAFDQRVYQIETLSYSAGTWKASMRGLLGKTQRAYGSVVTRLCRNSLGDGVCRVDLDAGRITRTVSTVVDARRKFTTSLTGVTNPYTAATVADGYFVRGRLVWTSGDSIGVQGEIRTHIQASGTLELELQTPFDIQVGDQFTLEPGCDQLLETCRVRFGNRLNYLGAPQVPGMNRVLYARNDG